MLYSSIAKFYDVGLRLNGYKRVANYFVAQLPFKIEAPFRVLDAGCGTGLYSLAILKRFPNARVVAFDLSKEMIQQMKANIGREKFVSRTRVFSADIVSDLSQIDKNFDLIVTGGVLEYVDQTSAIGNLARFLVVEGYFFNSPVKDNFWGKVVGRLSGFEPYDRKQNTEAFTQNGFRLEKIIELPMRYLLLSLVKEAHLFSSRG